MENIDDMMTTGPAVIHKAPTNLQTKRSEPTVREEQKEQVTKRADTTKITPEQQGSMEASKFKESLNFTSMRTQPRRVRFNSSQL